MMGRAMDAVRRALSGQTLTGRARGDVMKAVVVTPGKARSARVMEVPMPQVAPDQVLVKTLRVGICGTDVEIDRAEYGQAPTGQDYLVLCHENFGQVEAVGEDVTGFAPGDYVVAMVRRPDDCHHCRAGEQDMCITGRYTERGIKGRDGFLSQYYAEAPPFLIKVPSALKEVGVLLEPLTVVEKGIRHAWAAQGRMKAWEPARALILGAGPIGLMGAMATRLRGMETIVYSRDPDERLSKRVAAIGGRYVPKLDEKGDVINHIAHLPETFGGFDFILEATGSAQVAMGAMRIIGVNGILCLTSVTGGESAMEICPDCLNFELVLGNRTVFGSVNAHRVDFEQGVTDLAACHEQWPGWLDGLITRRVPLSGFREGLDRKPGDVKVVVELSPAA